jgi:hypothetical protein
MLEPAGVVQGACEGLKLGTSTRQSVLLERLRSMHLNGEINTL